MMKARKSTPEITLYSFAMSPYVIKIHCCLLYKNIDFNIHYLNPITRKKELPIGDTAPVLKIGDESKADSTPIAIWLDDYFPGHPKLLPDEPKERESLLRIVKWIDDCFVPSHFRRFSGSGDIVGRIKTGWRLGYNMHHTCHGGLPVSFFRYLWPFILQAQPFVKNFIETSGSAHLSREETQIKMIKEFKEHLGGGPFFGERSNPSLADFSIYPVIVVHYMAGVPDAGVFLEDEVILDWAKRVQKYVQGSPSLLPLVIQKNSFFEDFVYSKNHKFG